MTLAAGVADIAREEYCRVESVYGTGLPVVGTFAGALSDAGEEITLAQGNSTVFDSLTTIPGIPITDGADIP